VAGNKAERQRQTATMIACPAHIIWIRALRETFRPTRQQKKARRGQADRANPDILCLAAAANFNKNDRQTLYDAV